MSDGNREQIGTAESKPWIRTSVGHHWWFGSAFYALAAVAGSREIFYEMHPLPELLIPLGMHMALSGWVIADSAYRKRPLPVLSLGWVFVFAYAAVPVYAFKSRGARGGAWLVLHTFCWLMLCAAVTIAGQLAAFGDSY